MLKHCEHCISLIVPLANELRYIREAVLTNKTPQEAKPHFSQIKQHCDDITQTLNKIDCYLSPDDVLNIYDTLQATTNDLCQTVNKLLIYAEKTMSLSDGQAKLDFSGCVRDITKHLVDIKAGFSQLQEKIPTMKMIIVRPVLRKHFSDLIDIIQNIIDLVGSNDYSNVNVFATRAKDVTLLLCDKALEDTATEADKKAVITCFTVVIRSLLPLKSSRVTHENIREINESINLFKRAVRSMAMGVPVVIKEKVKDDKTEQQLLEKKQELEAAKIKKEREDEKKKLQLQIEENKKREEQQRLENQRIEEMRKKLLEDEKNMEKSLNGEDQEISQKLQSAMSNLSVITEKLKDAQTERDKLLNEESKKRINDLEHEDILMQLEQKRQMKEKLLAEKSKLQHRLNKPKKQKKTNISGRKPIIGDFGKTIRRQQTLSKELPVKQLSAVEMRKQLEIDKTARVLKVMSEESEPSVIEIASALKGLTETLDLENIENTTDVYQILKQTDFNSIALRITSPKFRISSSISYIGHYVSDEEYDPNDEEVTKLIEEYEKEAFYDLAEKASEIATTVEDTMCFGSLSVVAITQQSSDEYFDDLKGSCELARTATTKFMQAIPLIYLHGAGCKKDESLITAYSKSMLKIPTYDKKETVELVDYFESLIERIKRQEFTPTAKNKYIDASLGTTASMRGGLIYELVRQNASKMRSIVGQFLALSTCISHLKPKDLKYLQDDKKFDAKEFEKECEKFDKCSKEQLQRELFYSVDVNKGYDREILYLLEIGSLSTNLIHILQDFIDAVYTLNTLKQREGKLKASIDSSPVAKEIDEKSDIKKVKNDKANKTFKVEAGSLNQLVYLFVTEFNSFRETFLQTFPMFTKSSVVLSKLIGMHLGPNSFNQQTKQRALVAINYFINESFKQFDTCSIQTIKSLIDELFKRKEDNSAKSLNNLLQRKLTERNHQISESLVPQIAFFIPQEAISPSMVVQLSDAAEVAQQITLVTSKLFSNIESSEFYNNSWMDEKLIPQAFNIVRLIRHTDSVTDWVISSIIMFFTPENRIKAAIHFILIAENLLKLNNYQTLVGVLRAFKPNSRLSELKIVESLPTKFTKLLSSLQKIVSEKNNYKSYRQHFEKCTDSCVPLLDALFKDIKSIEEDYPEKKKIGNVEAINFKRCELLNETIHKVLRVKERTYYIPLVEPLSTFLYEMVSINGKSRDEIFSMWRKLIEA
ncbi:Ras guanine nucleotide exchange factor [Entamoeba marina]